LAWIQGPHVHARRVFFQRAVGTLEREHTAVLRPARVIPNSRHRFERPSTPRGRSELLVCRCRSPAHAPARHRPLTQARQPTAGSAPNVPPFRNAARAAEIEALLWGPSAGEGKGGGGTVAKGKFRRARNFLPVRLLSELPAAGPRRYRAFKVERRPWGRSLSVWQGDMCRVMGRVKCRKGAGSFRARGFAFSAQNAPIRSSRRGHSALIPGRPGRALDCQIHQARPC